MAHKSAADLQKQAHSLAKAVRQEPGTSDELYQLFTVMHARLRLLEESPPAENPYDYHPWTRHMAFWNTLGTVLGAVSGQIALLIVLCQVLGIP